MPEDRPPSDRLPRQRMNRLVEPIARFLQIEAVSGIVLLLATAVALILANSPWAGGFLGFWEAPVGVHLGPVVIVDSLRHAINDGLMTLFFFVVGLGIKREVMPGELRRLRVRPCRSPPRWAACWRRPPRPPTRTEPKDGSKGVALGGGPGGSAP